MDRRTFVDRWIACCNASLSERKELRWISGTGGDGDVSELSKLKLELYDLAAIILPGFFLIGELFALVKGIPPVFVSLQSISGAGADSAHPLFVRGG